MEFFDKEQKPQTEIQVKKQQEHRYKYIGSILHRPGHTLFSVNTRTGEIKPAKYIQEAVIENPNSRSVRTRRKVVLEKDCVFIEALNEKNALKRYMRMPKKV